MFEAGAIEALKAAVRGAVQSGAALGALQERVEALTTESGPDAGLLEELTRVAAGMAIATAALRGLSETLAQREAPPPS